MSQSEPIPTRYFFDEVELAGLLRFLERPGRLSAAWITNNEAALALLARVRAALPDTLIYLSPSHLPSASAEKLVEYLRTLANRQNTLFVVIISGDSTDQNFNKWFQELNYYREQLCEGSARTLFLLDETATQTFLPMADDLSDWLRTFDLRTEDVISEQMQKEHSLISGSEVRTQIENQDDAQEHENFTQNQVEQIEAWLAEARESLKAGSFESADRFLSRAAALSLHLTQNNHEIYLKTIQQLKEEHRKELKYQLRERRKNLLKNKARRLFINYLMTINTALFLCVFLSKLTPYESSFAVISICLVLLLLLLLSLEVAAMRSASAILDATKDSRAQPFPLSRGLLISIKIRNHIINIHRRTYKAYRKLVRSLWIAIRPVWLFLESKWLK